MITILLFAHLQEEAKSAELILEIDNITVQDLKVKLKEEYGLSQLEQVMVAINEDFALSEDMIHAGDTVALIPPVSGG